MLLYRSSAAKDAWVSVRVHPALVAPNTWKVTKSVANACLSRYGYPNSTQLQVRFSDRTSEAFAVVSTGLPRCKAA